MLERRLQTGAVQFLRSSIGEQKVALEFVQFAGPADRVRRIEADHRPGPSREGSDISVPGQNRIRLVKFRGGSGEVADLVISKVAEVVRRDTGVRRANQNPRGGQLVGERLKMAEGEIGGAQGI